MKLIFALTIAFLFMSIVCFHASAGMPIPGLGGKTSTTTSVVCASPTYLPSSYGYTTAQCVVSVAGDNPAGFVTLTSSSAATTFTPSSTCLLSSYSCTFIYTELSSTTPTITATYLGDLSNDGSSGTSTFYSSSSAASSSGSSCSSIPAGLSSVIGSWYCPINAQIEAQWSTEWPIAAAAVLLAFSIASLIIMVGIAFKNERIRNFGVAEMYEAIASAIMVGIFLYVCAVAFGVFPGVLVGAINPYATALNLITGTIDTAESLLTSMFNVYYFMRWFLTQSISIYTPVVTIPVQILLNAYGLYANLYYLDPARAISFFLTDGILALWAEYYLITFFSVAAIPVFIVPGVIFRTFLPTRSLGGVLMAIGISFYLVMPSLFSIAYYLTTPAVQTSMETAAVQITRYGTGASAISNAESATSPLALQLNDIQSNMASFWLLVLFYPTLIMGIVYATIAQLSNFLGATYGNAGKLRSFV